MPKKNSCNHYAIYSMLKAPQVQLAKGIIIDLSVTHVYANTVCIDLTAHLIINCFLLYFRPNVWNVIHYIIWEIQSTNVLCIQSDKISDKFGQSYNPTKGL